LIRDRLSPPPENDALARLVREAWTDGPATPAVDTLLRTLRPALGRVDAEVEAQGLGARWRELLRGLLAPAAIGGLAGAATVAVLALALLRFDSATSPTAETGPITTVRVVTASADDSSPISDLQSEAPLLVFEAEDGATVIWVVEDNDDLSGLQALHAGDA
jgi:hypothetical protein